MTEKSRIYFDYLVFLYKASKYMYNKNYEKMEVLYIEIHYFKYKRT